VLPEIVRALDERHIELAEFSLRKSSLDEVFLTLTGHKAEDNQVAMNTEPAPAGLTVGEARS
jgi:oleandomycin transport system ATP-binding protein